MMPGPVQDGLVEYFWFSIWKKFNPSKNVGSRSALNGSSPLACFCSKIDCINSIIQLFFLNYQYSTLND